MAQEEACKWMCERTTEGRGTRPLSKNEWAVPVSTVLVDAARRGEWQIILSPHVYRLTELFDFTAQQFGDAPRLSNAAARRVRRIAVKYFRDLSEACRKQMLLQLCSPLPSLV